MFLSPVVVQTDVFRHLENYLPELNQYSQFVVLLHPQLKERYAPFIFSFLQEFKCPILEIMISEGECSKSLTQAKRCWQQMVASGIDRKAAVVALGGGVICDLAGFVASCYMRGLDTFYFPTTLLAMVDAAIGGKTGVNLPSAKNMIGTFHQPQKIIIDPSCLKTLPQREFNSGIAEIIKYGMMHDPLLIKKLEKQLEELKNREEGILEETIQRCVEIKQEIISHDERDLLDQRIFLNYGHTFGHAIEAVTGYQRYLHGEAVALGMSCAAHLSLKLGLCDSTLIQRQDDLCQRAHLPIQIPHLPIERLIARMRSDKKSVCGKINLILLERLGKVVKICDVDSVTIRQLLLNKMGFC